MSDIRNCRRCGKMFDIALTKKPICPVCSKREDEDFEVARAYVKEHPGCNIQEVSDETGVSQKLIIKFLKEKRLELYDEDGKPSYYLVCEKCGSQISSGRLCNTCLNKLGKEMLSHSDLKRTSSRRTVAQSKTSKAPDEQKGRGMHYKKGDI